MGSKRDDRALALHVGQRNLGQAFFQALNNRLLRSYVLNAILEPCVGLLRLATSLSRSSMHSMRACGRRFWRCRAFCSSSGRNWGGLGLTR